MAKISLERGGDSNSIWQAGRGYQSPADRGGGGDDLPQGWDVAPHEEDQPMKVGERDRVSVVPPAPTPPTPPDELMEAVRIELSRLEIPEELVNLDKGSARFRGHNLHLSPETSAAINKLLAQEVVRKLEEEQRRVIDSVQHTNVSQSPSRGRPNLPAMQGAKEPVGKKATKRSKKMLRVRSKTTRKKLEDVSMVQGYKDNEEGAGPNS